MERQKVICIDESGRFESREQHARFLGGFVFTGANPAAEERRLMNLLTETAEELTAKYQDRLDGGILRFPYSFHMSALKVFRGDGEQTLEDVRLCRTMRGGILQKLKDYFRKHPKDYQLFALVVPFKNAQGFETEKESQSFNLTDFRMPGVLYERLVTGLVHNFTFYSLDDTEKNIFKIALRTPTLPRSELTAQQLQELRKVHQVSVDSRQNVHLTQTSINTFKASLSEKIFEGGAVNRLAVKNLEIDCQSMDYTGRGEREVSVFYYLADLVCYYLQRLFYGNGNNDRYENFRMDSDTLEAAKKTAWKECALPVFFWAYEETDRMLKRAIESYAAGNLAETFSFLYEMKNGTKELCKEYYESYWEPRLLQVIRRDYVENKNPDFMDQLSAALSRIEYYMHKRAEYRKAEYILTHLETLARDGSYLEKEDRNDIRVQKYRMADLFLQLHNHNGSVKNSRACFRRLLQYSDAVGTEELIGSINRGVQIYFNQFEYDTIISVYENLLGDAYDIRKAYRKQREMTELVLQDPDLFGETVKESEGRTTCFPWIGKMMSSLGQAYAFAGKYGEAKKCFREAVREFPDAGNRAVTNGYYLHVLIEEKNREQYLEDSALVFGTADLQEQLREILQAGISGIARFNLFIWIKAAFCFDLIRNGTDRRLLTRLIREIQETCAKNAAFLHQHPWELIFKYLFLLCRAQDMEEEAGYFMEKCTEPWNEDEETVLVIKEFGAWECAKGEAKAQAAKRLGDICSGMESMKELAGAEDQEAFLRKRLTYMYH